MKNKSEKSKELFNELRDTYDTVVMAGNDGEDIAIGIKGTTSEILYTARQLAKSIRKNLTDRYGETVASGLIKVITYTDEELKEEDRKLSAEIEKIDIPEWLKKLMFKEKDDEPEDDTDVQDDSVDPEEEAVRKAVDALVKALRNCDSN